MYIQILSKNNTTTPANYYQEIQINKKYRYINELRVLKVVKKMVPMSVLVLLHICYNY